MGTIQSNMNTAASAAAANELDMDSEAMLGIGINNHDSRLVEDSWKSIPDKSKIGAAVMNEMFENAPENLKTIFNFESGDDAKTVRKRGRYQVHAQKITSFLTDVMDGINDHVLVMQLAQDMGTEHAKLMIANTSYRVFDWMSFAYATANAVEKELPAASKNLFDPSRTKRVWQILMLRIEIEMQQQFYKDLFKIRNGMDTGDGKRWGSRHASIA